VADPQSNCVPGYAYYPGDVAFNNAPTFYPNAASFWDQKPIFAIKTSDKAYYPIMWTDITRKFQGVWEKPTIGPQGRGVNHFEKSVPVGMNEGYLDGHVEWAKASKFLNNPKMNYSSLEIYFYAGR